MRGNPGYLVVGFCVGGIVFCFTSIAWILGTKDPYGYLVGAIIIIVGLLLYGVSWLFGDANCTKGVEK